MIDTKHSKYTPLNNQLNQLGWTLPYHHHYLRLLFYACPFHRMMKRHAYLTILYPDKYGIYPLNCHQTWVKYHFLNIVPNKTHT